MASDDRQGFGGPGMTSQSARDIGSLPPVCLTRSEPPPPPSESSQSRVVHKAAKLGNNDIERVRMVAHTFYELVPTTACVTTGTNHLEALHLLNDLVALTSVSLQYSLA